jgi:hypothetical protein
MKFILRFISIIYVKYLNRRYKKLSIKSEYNSSNQLISKLILIQSILYYFKNQFSAWGYFHPDCSWSEKDEQFFRKLFPEKKFKENDIVIWHNPNAVTYYHNKIFDLTRGKFIDYSCDIKKQLVEWKDWN